MRRSHHLERRPGLGVDDVGALEGLFHVVADAERAARSRGLFAGQFDHLGHQVVALGVGQRHVHAEAGHEADDALRHRERLAVARRIGPGHGDLLAAQPLEPAEAALEVQQVGQRLGRVVDVALQVDHRGPPRRARPARSPPAGRRPPRACSGCPRPRYMSSRMPIDLGQERDHVGRLAHGLAVGDLRLRLVEVGERPGRGRWRPRRS